MSGYIEVMVSWTESWDRKTTARINEAELREWTEVPEGPIDPKLIENYLNAGFDVTEWHPGTLPTEADSYDDSVIDRCEVIGTS